MNLAPGCLLFFMISLTMPWPSNAEAQTPEGQALLSALLKQADRCPTPKWQPMLRYLADLHGKSVYPATGHLKYAYEAIGPKYQGGRVFGHIDLTHERLDTLGASPSHVRDQLRNELAGQQEDGLIPGVVFFDAQGKPTWKKDKGFPPLWVVSADEYWLVTRDKVVLAECLEALIKQIGWFERVRSAKQGGFYYLDVLQKTWESGMDEGVRYDKRPSEASASVDASAHVYMLYDHAARWSRALGKPAEPWEGKAKELQHFIQAELWDAESRFFYDKWSVHEPSLRPLAFEGMWPVVTGAATAEQAKAVIERHLMNPNEFFTAHPIATIGINDPKFSLRMWRGPAWNCMTYWAARGCVRYGCKGEAAMLLEAALDATAVDFTKTGTLWEFYHPQQGNSSALSRKSKGPHGPYRDYIGHNPLFAMVALWEECQK